MITSTTSPPDPSTSTSTSTASTSTTASPSPTIPTRLLLLSDTHIRSRSKNPLPFPVPSTPVDIVIHAGDITDSSTLSEFRLCLSYLRRLNAPLKLIIAGNHDYTLDVPASTHIHTSTHSQRKRRPDIGDPGEAISLLTSAAKDGIFYLQEGTHHFGLSNGAQLTVYASPATPAFGSQGFQYTQQEGHVFDIPPEADIVISHGPPRGILDVSRLTRASCGSVELWEAVKRTRPKLHVFGHIHEAWGAAAVKWKPDCENGNGEVESAKVLEDRRGVEEGWKDSKEERKRKEEKVDKIVRDGYYHLKYDRGEDAEQTSLFVNAAVMYAPGCERCQSRGEQTIGAAEEKTEASDGKHQEAAHAEVTWLR
ncbi:Metallo-dependent phosphatase [Neurospora crassa]|nr:Metallo-dependent phosphatase [Neurospora crassa]